MRFNGKMFRCLGFATIVFIAAILVASPVGYAQNPRGSLTIGRPFDADSLDPYEETGPQSRQIYDNILEPLVRMDPDGSLKPRLATSWKQMSELKWVFNLRKGVKFHSGNPFNAQAVKFHFDRILDPKKPGRPAALLSFIDSVKAVDDYTVEITTKTPMAALLANLAAAWCNIIDPGKVKESGVDYGRHATGTGPWKLKEWVPRDHITLVRNEEYWGKKPAIETVVFRVIPDGSSRAYALLTGELDAIYSVPSEFFEQMEKEPSIRLLKETSYRTAYFALDTSKPPLDDARVRQAINFAIDRNNIVDHLLRSSVSKPKGFLSPTVNGFAEVGGWQFNPDKARKLLAEAGWKAGSGGVLEKDGKPLKLKFLTSIGRYPKEREIAEVVQSQLSEIGVKLEIVAQEWVAHLASGFKGDYDVYMYGWGVATGDADYGLYNIFHSSLMPPISPKGNNFSKLKDPSIDRLVESAKVERDDKKRNDLYRRAQVRLKELEPLVILYHFYETVASKKYVEGLAPHPGEHLRVENAVLKK